MQNTGLTSKHSLKHGFVAGIVTILVIYGLGYAWPALSNGVQLNAGTLFAIFAGAMLGAMLVVKDLTKNLLFDGFIGGVAAVGTTSVLYLIMGAASAMGALIGLLFVATFISTIVVKKMKK